MAGAAIYRAEKLALRDPLALCIDLFLLQGVLPPDELDRLFDPVQQELLIRVGLLAVNEDKNEKENKNGFAGARASLFPVGNALIFGPGVADAAASGCVKVPSDRVMFHWPRQPMAGPRHGAPTGGGRAGSLHRVGSPCPARRAACQTGGGGGYQ